MAIPKTVKFLHPGPQWRSDQDEGTAGWLRLPEPHTRRFFEVDGQYLTDLDGPVISGPMGFWGEYEAPTRFKRVEGVPAAGHPRFIHTPLPLTGVKPPSRAHNSDPLVFGSHWLYSNCRQRAGPGLKRLERGDTVIFGSLVDRAFVLDTVLVIADAVPYRGGAARETVGGLVPEHVYRLVLDQVREPIDFMLYIGATHASPVDGRFSFVPAAPADGRGFARPAASASLQSQQAMGYQFLDDPAGYWLATALTVLGQGLCLGVHAELEAVGDGVFPARVDAEGCGHL